MISFAIKKELHFFDRATDYKRGIKHYLKNFQSWNASNSSNKFSVDDYLVNMEATPFYIASRSACSRLQRMIPGVKIILMMREPVARAYSEYQMKFRY